MLMSRGRPTYIVYPVRTLLIGCTRKIHHLVSQLDALLNLNNYFTSLTLISYFNALHHESANKNVRSTHMVNIATSINFSTCKVHFWLTNTKSNFMVVKFENKNKSITPKQTWHFMPNICKYLFFLVIFQYTYIHYGTA